jgi:hypothetical protein
MRKGSCERTPRKPSTLLTDVLESRLLLYTMAAGATLAATTPSQAQVMFTPNSTTLKPPSKLVIDLNHDGVADFLLVVKETFSFSGYQSSVVRKPMG